MTHSSRRGRTRRKTIGGTVGGRLSYIEHQALEGVFMQVTKMTTDVQDGIWEYHLSEVQRRTVSLAEIEEMHWQDLNIVPDHIARKNAHAEILQFRASLQVATPEPEPEPEPTELELLQEAAEPTLHPRYRRSRKCALHKRIRETSTAQLRPLTWSTAPRSARKRGKQLAARQGVKATLDHVAQYIPDAIWCGSRWMFNDELQAA